MNPWWNHIQNHLNWCFLHTLGLIDSKCPDSNAVSTRLRPGEEWEEAVPVSNLRSVSWSEILGFWYLFTTYVYIIMCNQCIVVCIYIYAIYVQYIYILKTTLAHRILKERMKNVRTTFLESKRNWDGSCLSRRPPLNRIIQQKTLGHSFDNRRLN